MAELDAINCYNQGANVCKDMELKAILDHNREEEKELAVMLLEWIRRKDLGLTEKNISHSQSS